MRKKMHKWFWAWDFDKEEKWLNKMADMGWSLVSCHYISYEFEKTEPQAYTYRIELLENHINHAESQAYLEFLEETGAEQIGSWIRWVYLRKKRELGTFELFSDFDSRITHLKRINYFILPLGLLNLANGINNLSWAFRDSNILSPGNFWIGMLCIAIALLACIGCLKIYRKIEKLKKERQIYE